MRVCIERLEVSALNVPLIEPFVIASGRMDATRAMLVQATLRAASGSARDQSDHHHDAWATGLGEAAALPPVTAEDQPDIGGALQQAESALVGQTFASLPELTALLDTLELSQRPVARSGLECALLDAWARLHSVPLCTLLTGAAPGTLCTDITLPIAAPEHMLQLAIGHRARGFRIFKVKIGKSIDDDLRVLSTIASRIPDAHFRLDANAAFSAEQAGWLLDEIERAALPIACFEQPCARDDLDGMARVTCSTRIPVIADESIRTLADLELVHARGAARGVNLKLAKSGGVLAALAIGQRARELGMLVMCGGMVETRLGMTAMGHVACALQGVEYVDLDTAFLLASDPFEGGYVATGSELAFGSGAGLNLRLR